MMTGEATHQDMANALRALAIDGVEAANSGHPGMPMGMADVATVLWSRFLKFDAGAPDWPDRDRFVLSAGHGSMLLYALLHLSGFADLTIDELKRFRQIDSRTPGHPEYGHAAGVETTTGPLGQGLATAVGMAMAERKLAARFDSDLVDHHTYVIASDGDLMEGVSHEAISLAARYRLNRLIVLFDDNDISIDGPVSLAETGDQLQRFEAAGWRAERIDGHDPDAIAAAISRAKDADTPSLIACKTVIGKGAPTKQGTAGVHGAPLGPDEAIAAKKALGCDWPAFDVPETIVAAWRAVGAKGRAMREAWSGRLQASQLKAAFDDAMKPTPDFPAITEAIRAVKTRASSDAPSLATRKASGEVLEALAPACRCLIGGSADLTGSNNTRAQCHVTFDAPDYAGDYVHYGVREHGMAAAMNGMALHRGLRPYGGTFLVFSDYCRPAIRLSALMGVPTIYVFTHDSIGLGEDGPTHQPVEHLAALRAIPNLLVFRPADLTETAECWETMLAQSRRPSAIVLSRQSAQALRRTFTEDNQVTRGLYVLDGEDVAPELCLVGSGTETALAAEAAARLRAKGVAARAVSAPCLELFATQDQNYKDEILPAGAAVVAIEAAVAQGWADALGRLDGFVGMQGFGASAPAKDLYARFEITVEKAVAVAMAALERRRSTS